MRNEKKIEIANSFDIKLRNVNLNGDNVLWTIYIL